MRFKIKELRKENGSYYAKIEFQGAIRSYRIRTSNCGFCFCPWLEGVEENFSIYTKDTVQILRDGEVDIKVEGLTPEARILEGSLERELKEFALTE